MVKFTAKVGGFTPTMLIQVYVLVPLFDDCAAMDVIIRIDIIDVHCFALDVLGIVFL